MKKTYRQPSIIIININFCMIFLDFFLSSVVLACKCIEPSENVLEKLLLFNYCTASMDFSWNHVSSTNKFYLKNNKPVLLVNRLQALERSLIIENGETSSVVQDMKMKVDSFKEKLEVCQHLIWRISMPFFNS